MLRVSNSSPVALRKDHDSFFLYFLYIWFAALFPSFLFQQIFCLFAKFKDLVVVVGEEHTTDDSVPKVENEKNFSKLKDLVGEKDNSTNSNPKATSLTEQQKKELGNTSAYADLTREELNDEFTHGYYRPDVCYISPSDMEILPKLAGTYRSEYWNVESSDEEDYWHEECSDDECCDEDYALYLRLLEQSSDGTL
ncbi:hypothetical protein TSUD_263520 [Trifolium subterraneum]|uniref:Uncharacterized protein n=1 Tax=Trifolium subterraneum TaxID=3900 RepID=A0A2Z6NWL3_TRISU|nr:hypothetical protein TSUD_263520 [Trifolium subterraneum]